MTHRQQHMMAGLGLVILVTVLVMLLGRSENPTTQLMAGSDDLLKELIGDYAIDLDLTDATAVALSDEQIEVSGSGISVTDDTMTITAGGTYVLSGSLTDGRLLVNAKDQDVTLVLCGVDISCSYSSPLCIVAAKQTTLYVTADTVNAFVDGEQYLFTDSWSSQEKDEPNACIYAKSDLNIEGTGTLQITGQYHNGLTSKDTLTIADTTLIVTAQDHGVNGKDAAYLSQTNVTIKSGQDGLRSSQDTDATKGLLVIADSTLNIQAGEDGVQAETALTLTNCQVWVEAANGKALKAGTDLVIEAGTYQLNSLDDAIHSNGMVKLNGGQLTIQTEDDGIHADEAVQILDGDIRINQSYEGIEGTTVEIAGGQIQIVSQDDGINAAGGADQSGFGPRNDPFASQSDAQIIISGGTIEIDASGDGVDSNGDLIVSGGTLYVSGPANNGNGALDYGGEATISGGLVVASGASGMAQNFGFNSTQASILAQVSGTSQTAITLTDQTGKVLLSYTPTKNFSSVVLSCPALEVGETYTLTVGQSASTFTLSSLIVGSSGGMGNPGKRGPGGW